MFSSDFSGRLWRWIWLAKLFWRIFGRKLVVDSACQNIIGDQKFSGLTASAWGLVGHPRTVCLSLKSLTNAEMLLLLFSLIVTICIDVVFAVLEVRVPVLAIWCTFAQVWGSRHLHKSGHCWCRRNRDGRGAQSFDGDGWDLCKCTLNSAIINRSVCVFS